MRQVQRDSWRKKVLITSLLCSMMKVIFPHISVSIIQKRTPLKLTSLEKRTNLRTKQLKNARPQNLKILKLILQNTTRAPTPSSENIGRDAGK